MPIPTHEERIGTTLHDKYRLDGLLGRGGMAAVFAATHLWTERSVAVKMLNPEFASNAEMSERFLREARTSAGIKHPNVVDVLDMGSDGDAVYLVLERLDGRTLGALLEADGAQSPSICASVLVPVMEALVYAHDRGIVHRDLKPDNVFIATRPMGGFQPKLVDFGIAKVLDSEKRGQTRVGTVMGTPQYMSPEQATGAETLGPQADVWSMGVVWYEALSGKMPFDGLSSTATLLAIVAGKHVPLATLRPELPSLLCEVIEWALEPACKDRCPDMASFTKGLVAACRDAQIEFVDEIDLSLLPGPTLPPIPRTTSHPRSSYSNHSNRPPASTRSLRAQHATSEAFSVARTIAPRHRTRPFVLAGALALALGSALGTVGFSQRMSHRDVAPSTSRAVIRSASTAAAPSRPSDRRETPAVVEEQVIAPIEPREEAARVAVESVETTEGARARHPRLHHEPSHRTAAPASDPAVDPAQLPPPPAPSTPARPNYDPLTNYE